MTCNCTYVYTRIYNYVDREFVFIPLSWFYVLVVRSPECGVLTNEGEKAGIELNRNLFTKKNPPTGWGWKPSSEWERVGASRAR